MDKHLSAVSVNVNLDYLALINHSLRLINTKVNAGG